jgi:hypothetical protein
MSGNAQNKWDYYGKEYNTGRTKDIGYGKEYNTGRTKDIARET